MLRRSRDNGMGADSASAGLGRLRQLARLLAIQRTLIRYGLEDIVWATHLFRPIGWLRRLLPKRTRQAPLGARIALPWRNSGPSS